MPVFLTCVLEKVLCVSENADVERYTGAKRNKRDLFGLDVIYIEGICAGGGQAAFCPDVRSALWMIRK